jgi:hypothetical protein
LASSLESEFKVPVKTIFLFVKKLFFEIFLLFVIFKIFCKFLTVLLLSLFEKYSINDEIAFGPKPSIFIRFSLSCIENTKESKSLNSLAKISEFISPIYLIPSE